MAMDMRDAVFDEIYSLAKADPNVVFLTADLGAHSLVHFRQTLPGQFINMGIAEQNMIAVAAGMAMKGKRIFVYSIIPFVTMRCLEHIKVCLADMHLPVCIVGSGAGFTYGIDGPTHHAIQDVGVMRALGNIAIYNPCDQLSATESIRQAYTAGGPGYIRIESGTYDDLYDTVEEVRAGMKKVVDGKERYIVSTGAMTHRVLKAMGASETATGVIDVCQLDTINAALLSGLLGNAKSVLSVEEHYVHGGLGTLLEETLASKGVSVRKLGVHDVAPGLYGNRDWLLEQHGISSPNLVALLMGESCPLC